MTELEMAALWAEILDVDDMAPDDHFTAVGGSSLLALDVVAALRERTGVVVPLRDFFADPTPRGVAAVVTARKAAAEEEGAAVR